MAIKNSELAVVAKNDPARLRTRTVETEARKLRDVRSRRKDQERREVRRWAE